MSVRTYVRTYLPRSSDSNPLGAAEWTHFASRLHETLKFETNNIRAHSAAFFLNWIESIWQNSTPFGIFPSPFGNSPSPFGKNSSPFGLVSSPFGQVSSPFGKRVHSAKNARYQAHFSESIRQMQYFFVILSQNRSEHYVFPSIFNVQFWGSTSHG